MNWLKENWEWDKRFFKEQLTWQQDESVSSNLLRMVTTVAVYGFFVWLIIKSLFYLLG